MDALNQRRLFVFLNAVQVVAIFCILFLAISFQVVFHELPCPLCLLQRVGFIGIAMGLLLNLRFQSRPSHYSLTILSALFTAFVALRQIFLHIVPGTGSYGEPVLGYHLYTWSFIIAMAALIYTAFIMAFGVQYTATHLKTKLWKSVVHICFGLIAAIALANAISTFMECGWKQCPENPTQYQHSILNR